MGVIDTYVRPQDSVYFQSLGFRRGDNSFPTPAHNRTSSTTRIVKVISCFLLIPPHVLRLHWQQHHNTVLAYCGLLNYVQGIFQQIKFLRKKLQKEKKIGDEEESKHTSDLSDL